MIVVKLMGGLGNQMFQYALGRHLSLMHRTGLKLDTTFLLDRSPRDRFVFRDYDLPIFGIDNLVATREDLGRFPHLTHPRLYRHVLRHFPRWSRHVCRERDFSFDPAVLHAPDNSYLDGYWQDERYFSGIGTTIRQDFVVREPADRAMAGLIRGTEAVCVNVRRGDYVTNPHSSATHGFMGEEYYRKAIRFMEETVEDPAFFVFSDDLPWCRDHLPVPPGTTFVTHEYAGTKFGAYLTLMTLCRHFIIPNSTFAWWAAWLCAHAGKTVIAPAQWYRDPVTSRQFGGLIPTGWTRM